MARVAVEIPKVGLVMESARLLRWLKAVGDTVTQGEPLLEVETEKSIVEIEATDSGRLVEILLEADHEVGVGERVGWLEVGAAVRAADGGPRVRSSPVARRVAAEHALDLHHVAGTGPRGRVQLADVRHALDHRRASEASTRTTSQGLPPLSKMRRALARSMTLSNATVPQFNVERAVDWTILRRVRDGFRAKLPPAAPCPSINDFLLHAIARNLMAFTAMNATFSGDPDSPDANIIPASGTHVGLVVAMQTGLLIPVFHDVERIGLAELAFRRADTVNRALRGKLKREELEGATFSVSNLGARGPDRFTAVINPPQAAILAVGRQRDCVTASEGQIHIKPMSQLTLTVDHRVTDGQLASDFLSGLTQILEAEAWRL